MTPQETIKSIKLLKDLSIFGAPSLSKSVDEAISALELKQQLDDLGLTIKDVKAMKEKQIPKHPLKTYGGAHRCPNCQMKHFDPQWVGTKYCSCGQALDWSEVEK